MADKPVKRVTKDMLEAARLLASGEHTVATLAVRFNKSKSSIRRWINNPAVLEEYRAVLRASEKGLVAKARRVLEKGLDSPEGYLALQSAQTTLSRYDAPVMGDNQQEVTLRIIGYTPSPGMPERSEEE